MNKVYLSLVAGTLLCSAAASAASEHSTAGITHLDRQYNARQDVLKWAKALDTTIDSQATFSENVKILNRAFKRRSVTCHPDKTTDPALIALFKIITNNNDSLKVMHEEYQKRANPGTQQHETESLDADLFISSAVAGIDSTALEAQKLSTKLPVNIQASFMQMGYRVLDHIKKGTFNPVEQKYYDAMAQQKGFPKIGELLYAPKGASLDFSLLFRSTGLGEPKPKDIRAQQSYLTAVIAVSWAVQHIACSKPYANADPNAFTLVSGNANLNNFFMGYGELASRMSGTLGRTVNAGSYQLDMRFLRNQGYLQLLPNDCAYMEVSVDHTENGHLTTLTFNTLGNGSVTSSVASTLSSWVSGKTEVQKTQENRLKALTEYYKAATGTDPKKTSARDMYADLLSFDQEHAEDAEETTHAETFYDLAKTLFGDDLLPFRRGFEKVIRFQD